MTGPTRTIPLTSRRRGLAAAWLALAAACATRGDEPAPGEGVYGQGPTPKALRGPYPHNRPKIGPPPPGYWRIRADAAPGFVDGQPGVVTTDTPTWTFLGPRPITGEYWSGGGDASGRVVSVATHPTNPLIAYGASASGGLWKTVDGGANWASLTDALPTLTAGCVVLDPQDPNVVYLGTGEFSVSSGGDGLFRSGDAGATWTRVGTRLQIGSNTSRVAVDPTDALVLHVTSDAGYNRSDDGGLTWTRPIPGSCSDLALDPLTPANVYVAKAGDGVYKSTDGGATFTRLGVGLPNPGSGQGRIALALAASAPSTLHAAFVDAQSNGLFGHFATGNGGASWSPITTVPNYPSPQGWYDLTLAISPTDPNVVVAGGVFPLYSPAGLVYSQDGGATWQDITLLAGQRPHPDFHAIAFGSDGALWTGTDGGVWKLQNGGWVNTNATLGVTQFYHVAVHPTSPQTLVGGTQDNGAALRTASDAWPQVLYGDGGFSTFDFVDPTRQYLTYIYLEVYRRSSAGFVNITGPWTGEPREFIAPMVIDPNDANTLLGGTHRVWRTTDAAATATWSPLSPAFPGTITAIAVAPGDSQTIYVGTSVGAVHATFDGGATWTNRSAGLPGYEVTDFAVDPADASVCYVGVARSFSDRLFRTDDGGLTWLPAGGSLPAGLTPKALAVDWRLQPRHLYVGTGAGVQVSTDGGANWTAATAGMPNVNATDLVVRDFDRSIVVATYGRGVYAGPLADCGAFVPYGAPTPGANGAPTLAAGGCAAPGQAFTITTQGPANSLGVLAIGFAAQSTQWNGLLLLQSLDVTITETLDATGEAALTFPVPATTGLSGLHLFFQCAVLDASTTSGFAASAGLDVTIP